MPLPDNFSSWEHLQSILMRTYNREVDNEFRDIQEDDNLNIPRSSLKIACRIRDDDSAIVALMRMNLFYYTLRKASELQRPIYGIPVDDYQSDVKFRPLIKLYFRQDSGAVPAGRAPVRAQISYRLRNETSQSITEAELRQHALRIRSEFAPTGSGYVWTRGKILVTYKNLDEGLNLQIYASSKAEAITVIRKVCDCATVPYHDDNLTTHTPERSFPSNAGNQMVLGRSRPIPVRRPTANVRFTHATASIHGIAQDITLVDNPFSRRSPLVAVPDISGSQTI